MKALRVITGILASAFGNAFLAGAAYTLGNHLFEWHPDKVAVEWQLSLYFAAVYVAVGVVPAVVAAVWLQGAGRTITITFSSVCLGVGWAFLCLLTYRMNSGYLWLVVGVPVLTGYLAIRTLKHRRFARAA